MKSVRRVAIVPLLVALFTVSGCTAYQSPQMSASDVATPSVTSPYNTGTVKDPCQERLVSGYPPGSHAHPVVILNLEGVKELEAAKDVLLGSTRSENDRYGFAVTKGEFVHYLTEEEKKCVNSVSGPVDYYLTSVVDAPDLTRLLQLGGPSLFVSDVQRA